MSIACSLPRFRTRRTHCYRARWVVLLLPCQCLRSCRRKPGTRSANPSPCRAVSSRETSSFRCRRKRLPAAAMQEQPSWPSHESNVRGHTLIAEVTPVLGSKHAVRVRFTGPQNIAILVFDHNNLEVRRLGRVPNDYERRKRDFARPAALKSAV